MTTLPILRSLLKRKPNAFCQQRLSDHVSWSQTYDGLLQELQARRPDLLIYSPLHLLCDTDRDLCPMVRDGAFLYSYGDHLSDVGNNLIGPDVLRRMGLDRR